jgi:inositol hexakisphosphate/diphosphoinositol-pentakisphosphate kinase
MNNENDNQNEIKIKLGICTMEKKLSSKHMQNILKGLEVLEDFEIITFNEDIIFNQEIENWPIVESMIIFFSGGFPYSKALKYLELRKPFLINDFEIQVKFNR